MSEIFVFGSNLAGRHGKGSAAHAAHAVKKYGAIYGQGEGLQGLSYAIPTKDAELKRLPIASIFPGDSITYFVHRFLIFAECAPNLTFRCVAIGCGLAGYRPVDIAPLFTLAPENVILPKEFVDVLKKRQYT